MIYYRSAIHESLIHVGSYINKRQRIGKGRSSRCKVGIKGDQEAAASKTEGVRVREHRMTKKRWQARPKV
jgi:hypothetical protein